MSPLVQLVPPGAPGAIRFEPLVRGQISGVSARYLPEGAAAFLGNVDLTDPTAPSMRDGYRRTKVGSTGMTNGSLRIAALAGFDVSVASRLLVAAVPGSNGGVYVTSSPESSSGWTEATIQNGYRAGQSFNVVSESCRLVKGGSSMWVLPDPGVIPHLLKTDGKIIDPGDHERSPPHGVRDGCWLFERLWLLTRDRLYFSSVYPLAEQVEDWDIGVFDRTVTGYLPVSPSLSSESVAVRPWRDTALVVYGDNHIEWFGVNPSDPILSARRVLEPEVGCISPNTIVSVGDQQFFMDQWCQFRSLNRTLDGSLRGVDQAPVSEPIRDELSNNGRINKLYAHRSFAIKHESRIFVFYPRDNSQYPNAAAVLNLRLGIWEGIWTFAHTFTAAAITQARGRGRDLYLSSAAPMSRVYRMFTGGYTDDGEDIVLTLQTRAYDDGILARDKMPSWITATADGKYDAKLVLGIRTDESEGFVAVTDLTVESNADADFPLVDADEPAPTSGTQFPISDAPNGFPLIDRQGQPTTIKVHIDEPYEGDWPTSESSYPDFNTDYPQYEEGGAPHKGPFIQLQVASTGSGKPVALRHFEVDYMITAREMETGL